MPALRAAEATPGRGFAVQCLLIKRALTGDHEPRPGEMLLVADQVEEVCAARPQAPAKHRDRCRALQV
jgi:hypothetical protein